jgi:hypothetical protein
VSWSGRASGGSDRPWKLLTTLSRPATTSSSASGKLWPLSLSSVSQLTSRIFIVSSRPGSASVAT